MLSSRQLISIVIPVYNEQECLPEMFKRLSTMMARVSEQVEIECIFVDDGSIDNSLLLLKDEASKKKSFKIISFSRNFGHQAAITAGIDKSRGNFVAVIDSDLQDPPELIYDMYKIALLGFDVVYGKRRKRAGETLFKKWSASIFYKLLNRFANIEIPTETGDFRLLSRKVVNELSLMREQHRFIRGMVPWVGFKSKALEYDRNERHLGETKYPFKKMIAFAITAIFSFSIKPLTIATYLGVITIIFGLLGLIVMLYLKYFTNVAVPGLTAILFTITIFSGVQIFILGIIGQYIGRIFEQVKGRPLYIISETVNG